ncbi:MAG: endonuclease I [Vicingaceae bacterium]|jgi:endonuclease I
MKIAKIVTILICLTASPLFSQIPTGYYNSASGLIGDTLKDVLNDIIDGHIEFTYTSSSLDTWDILKKADKDPANSNNVIGIYSAFSMDGPLEYNRAQGWSREHVWAKSRGNFGTSRGVGTDLHNLHAEDVSTNSARNNRNFDTATTQYIDGSGNYNGPTLSSTSSSRWVWEPRDEMKGDVARVIFYMSVRYEGENGELDLELTDSLLPSSSQLPLHGSARTLYNWHLNDTVSIAERSRNDTIYKYQNNRNPFVDHPEYVRDIYGATYGPSTVSINENETTSESKYKIYPNPSNSIITIESNKEKIIELLVIDSKSKLVLKVQPFSNLVDIRLDELKSGMYFLKIKDSKGKEYTHRQLIQ